MLKLIGADAKALCYAQSILQMVQSAQLRKQPRRGSADSRNFMPQNGH
jgi:hypothetical protein